MTSYRVNWDWHWDYWLVQFLTPEGYLMHQQQLRPISQRLFHFHFSFDTTTLNDTYILWIRMILSCNILDTFLIWSNLCALKLSKNKSNEIVLSTDLMHQNLLRSHVLWGLTFHLIFSGHILGKVCGAPILFCVSSISYVFWYFYDIVRRRTKVVPCCHVHLSPEFCYAQDSFAPDGTPRDLVFGDYEPHVLLITWHWHIDSCLRT